MASRKARVWNKHPLGYAYSQTFKGELINIPANKFIVMDYDDAVEFKSSFSPMRLTPENTHDPKGFKCIFVEEIGQGAEITDQPSQFVCHVNGKVFNTEKELTEYVKTNFSHLLTVDAEGEEEVKRRRGRPRKEDSGENVSPEHL